MKKLYSFAFFFLIFVVKGFSESLYIVGGDAAFGGWSLGSAAAMTHNNNKYVWIGDVNAGTEFKFLKTNTAWFPAYTAKNKDEAVERDGGSFGIQLCDGEGCDNKFVFSQSGKYKIEVELGDSPTMTVTWLGEYGELYMVGTAIADDWDLNNATKMTYADGKYTWVGDLISGNGSDPGQLKFITSNDDFYPAFVASSNNELVNLNSDGDPYPYGLFYCGDEYCGNDNKFKFSSGKYKIEVILGDDPKMTVTRLGDYGSDLYMIGTAIPGRWELEKAIPMKYADGKYTWVGDLIYHDEDYNTNESTQSTRGELKFITSNDDFYPAFVASEADKEVDSGGGSYDLSYCGDEYCGNDNKFKFLSGKYKIEVELGNSPKMTVTRLGDYGMLYMVGDAVSDGWEPGGAQDMTYADGKYTWKGQLSGGEFKFLTTNTGLLPSYVSADADPGQSSKSIKINSGPQDFNLKYRDKANELSVNDYTFEIDGTVYSGEYEICVQLGTNPTVTITKKTKAGIPNELYINGDIVGWDATKSIEMTKDGNPAGVFTWTGSLPHGELKFLTVSPSEAQSSTNPWFPCYVATNGLSVVRMADNSVFKMEYRTEGTQNDVTDYKFFFYKGEYTLTVNLNGKTPKLTVNGTIDNLDINTNELSLIGNAVVGSRAKFTPVPCNGKRVFVYTGKMKCGQTNTFRFAWEPNEWPGMVAMGGHLTECTFDEPMSMVYIPSDKWDNAYDWRFYIDGAENEVRDVVIRINIMENVNDMTMTITGKAEDEVNYNFSAMYDNTSGKNIIIDGVEGDYSVTYMNGELISGTNDYTNDLNFTVPCNGIYVVKANCISKKVLIY